MSLRYPLAGAAVGLATVAVCLAQSAAEVTFRVRSEQVLVDLVARDQAGQAVTDLSRADIEVLEDGRKQELTHFSFLPRPLPARTPATAFRFAAPAPDLSLVILLDVGSLLSRDLQRIKEALAGFLAELPDQARVMVLSLGTNLAVLQPLQPQPENVMQVLAPLQVTMDPGSTAGTFTEFSRRLDEAFFQTPSSTAPFNNLGGAAEIANMGQFFLSTLEDRVAVLSEGVAALARRMRPLAGRKQLILFSTGYPLQPHAIVRDMIERRIPGGRTLRGAARQQLNAILSSGQKVNVTSYLDQAVAQANSAQVSIYAVDPRGLASAAQSGEASERAGLSDDYVELRREVLTRASHDFLRYLAEHTGGRTLVNQNELEEALNSVRTDSQAYYLLAYRPDTKRKAGRTHRIDVRSRRSGVTLRYRDGYIERGPEEELRVDVMTAVRYPGLFRGAPLQVETTRSGQSLQVRTLIPTRALRFHSDGTHHHNTLEVFGFLFDEEGKWVGKGTLFSKGHRFRLTAEQKENLGNYDNVTLTGECDRPAPGKYTMIVVVRQRSDGSICTHRRPLNID